MTIIKLLFYNFYSLFFCLRHLPFPLAIKIPILIHPSVKVKIESRKSIVFTGRIWRSICSIGFDGTRGRNNHQSMLCVIRGGKLRIGGFTVISKGTKIIVDGGEMSIGDNFFCNGDCFFNCTTHIDIGRDNMYGWNINFNTTDGHHIYVNGKQKEMTGNISIGNHVWIASYCNIAKSSSVADDSVVAQNSLVNSNFMDDHSLIGGVPAKKIKDNVSWHS